MSGSGSFRHKLFPVPRGKHLPSQIEDTLWHHFQGGEFSPRGAQEQDPELSFGRQGVQLRRKDFPKWKGGKGRDQLRDALVHSEQQFSECGLWNPWCHWDPFMRSLRWKLLSYHHSDIIWLLTMLTFALMYSLAVMETMVASCTCNYFQQNFLVEKKKTDNQVCCKTSRMTH